MNPYEILGCDPSATDEEIKKAYRKLSRMYHPDSNVQASEAEQKKSEENFKKVQWAYERICDLRSGKAQPNSAYDGAGNSSYGNPYGNPYGDASGRGGYGPYDFPFEDFFRYVYGAYASSGPQTITFRGSNRDILYEAYQLIRVGAYADADSRLNSISYRDAEWYFVHGVLLNHLGKNYEAEQDLEEACRQEPENTLFQSTLNQLRGGWQQYQNMSGTFGSEGRTGCGTNLCCLPFLCCWCGGGGC